MGVGTEDVAYQMERYRETSENYFLSLLATLYGSSVFIPQFTAHNMLAVGNCYS